MRATLGWAEIDRERKREIIEAIASGSATRGPTHLELDLTDRCNVDCYFCNQMEVRTTRQLPLERVVALVDELAERGLAAVRLSGGGDPLAHRQIVPVLDHLASRGVVVDNLTTNGALLSPEVAERLVLHRAREVIVSMNAADAADYARMMQVRPETFQRVTDNVRGLLERRAGGVHPEVVVQFLLDRQNFRRLPAMYDLGRSLGADRIAVGLVLPIPNQRIDSTRLINPGHGQELRPYVESVLRRDRRAGRLQISFPWPEWNDALAEIRSKLQAPAREINPIAPSYDETDNGWCFFGWFSAVVRGNGDLHPCCMLMQPQYEPLGNLGNGDGSFMSHWAGPTFRRMREEMRELFLSRGEAGRHPERFKILKPACTTPYRCFHKNHAIRYDQEFFRELSAALEKVRPQRSGWRRALTRLLPSRFARHHTVGELPSVRSPGLGLRGELSE